MSRDRIGMTMSCRHIDDLVIVVHNEKLVPTDAEWDRYVNWCTALLAKHEALRVLVISEKVHLFGGGLHVTDAGLRALAFLRKSDTRTASEATDH